MGHLKSIVLVLLVIALLLIVLSLLFLFTPLKKRVTKKSHYALLAVLSSLAVQILVMPFRRYPGMEVSSVVGFACYLITTNFFLKKNAAHLKSYQTILLILTGFIILQIPPRIDFKSTLISLPDFILELLGVCAGYFFYNRHRFVYRLNLTLSVLVVLFTFFYGYNLWANNLAFGSFTGNVHIKGPVNISLISNNNDVIKLKKGKITVLDFWFIGCGSCMNEFPVFQKTYDAYKTNPGIQFYSVNSPYPRDSDVSRFKMLTDLGYNFPMAVSPNAALAKALNVHSYPTIIILDKNGDVVYKGDHQGAEVKIKSLL